jgi:hypothetical protein
VIRQSGDMYETRKTLSTEPLFTSGFTDKSHCYT